MPVAIAGMHRSGTSMISRLLNLCGLYLGKEEDVIFFSDDNPEGFWENVKFQRINDEILTSFGGGWDLPPVLDVGWESSPHLATATHNTRQLIEEISQQSIWGWKDPRNSLTLPFWKGLLPNLKIVICLRNPFDVYRSLRRRGYSSSAFSYHLWLTYNQQLLTSTKPEERIITHYDSFFREPQSELRRLVNFLGLEVSDETINAACQTISIKLRHSRGSIHDLYATNPPDKLLDLYKGLCLRAGDLYGLSLSLEQKTFLQNIAPAEESEITALENDLPRIWQALKTANEEKSRLQQEIVILRKEKAAEIAKLREDKKALQSTIHHIFASRGWRLIQILQKTKQVFIPISSTREKILLVLFNALGFKLDTGNYNKSADHLKEIVSEEAEKVGISDR